MTIQELLSAPLRPGYDDKPGSSQPAQQELRKRRREIAELLRPATGLTSGKKRGAQAYQGDLTERRSAEEA